MIFDEVVSCVFLPKLCRSASKLRSPPNPFSEASSTSQIMTENFVTKRYYPYYNESMEQNEKKEFKGFGDLVVVDIETSDSETNQLLNVFAVSANCLS
jgi:hypothetical protein